MHHSKYTIITVMLSIHPSLCSLLLNAPEVCGTNSKNHLWVEVSTFYSHASSSFLNHQKKAWIQHQHWFTQRRFFQKACQGFVKKSQHTVDTTSCHVFSRHTDECAGDKDQQCGLYSELPAGINHCQDASKPLKLLFSWVLEITSSKSSKEQNVPDRGLHFPL